MASLYCRYPATNSSVTVNCLHLRDGETGELMFCHLQQIMEVGQSMVNRRLFWKSSDSSDPVKNSCKMIKTSCKTLSNSRKMLSNRRKTLSGRRKMLSNSRKMLSNSRKMCLLHNSQFFVNKFSIIL